jgi:hypothetical protein
MSDKILYVNGCSWSYGNGIEQDPSIQVLPLTNRKALQRQLNWASVLSRKLKRTVLNDSEGGGSNARMVRTTCEYLQSLPESAYEDLIVVLGWTTVDRNEIYLEDGDVGVWGILNATQPVSDHKRPVSKDFFKKVDAWQKQYVELVYNHYSNYQKYFQEMYLMSNVLENLGIQYVFFNSLPWRRDSWTHPANFDATVEFKKEIESIMNPKILNTRDCNDNLNCMSIFCRDNNIPMAADHHTMIEGHKRWADHLYREMIQLGYVS